MARLKHRAVACSIHISMYRFNDVEMIYLQIICYQHREKEKQVSETKAYLSIISQLVGFFPVSIETSCRLSVSGNTYLGVPPQRILQPPGSKSRPFDDCFEN